METRSLRRLAWNKTTFGNSPKIFASLVVPLLNLLSNWFSGLRTWEQALVYAACTIAVYGTVTLAEFTWRLSRLWLKMRTQHAIRGLEEWQTHFHQLEVLLAQMHSKWVPLSDSSGHLIEIWTEHADMRNGSSPRAAQLRRIAPEATINSVDVAQAQGATQDMARDMAHALAALSDLLNFRFSP